MISYIGEYDDPDPYSDNPGEGSLMISAEDQTWDKQTLQQLKDEYNIIFKSSGDGVRPVKVIKGSDDYYIAIGSEDDGTIYFDKSHGHYKDMFCTYWLDALIADLQEAKKYITELKEKEAMKKIKETDGYHNGEPIFCPVEGCDCPYYDNGLCFIRDPMEDCDDFASMFDSWEEWEAL